MWRSCGLVGLLVVSACGRIDFADQPDAPPACATPANHDEDGDAVDDGCDVCPHVADVKQPDEDRDGVGDLCDPLPQQPTERIVFFDPFVEARPEWMITTPVVLDGESLTVSSVNGQTRFDLVAPPAADVFQLGGQLTAGGSFRQVVLGLYAEVGFYYCELIDTDGITSTFASTHTLDFNVYAKLGSQVFQQPIDDAAVTLSIRNAPPAVHCATTWQGATPIDAAIPAGHGPAAIFVILIGNLDARLDYFIQIRSE